MNTMEVVNIEQLVITACNVPLDLNLKRMTQHVPLVIRVECQYYHVLRMGQHARQDTRAGLVCCLW